MHLHCLAGNMDHGYSARSGGAGFVVDLDIADMRGETYTGPVVEYLW
jgi:hypothetical protein